MKSESPSWWLLGYFVAKRWTFTQDDVWVDTVFTILYQFFDHRSPLNAAMKIQSRRMTLMTIPFHRLWDYALTMDRYICIYQICLPSRHVMHSPFWVEMVPEDITLNVTTNHVNMYLVRLLFPCYICCRISDGTLMTTSQNENFKASLLRYWFV